MYKGTVKIFQGLRPRPSNRLTIRRSPRHPTRRPPRSRRLRWPRGGSPPRHVKVTLGNGCVAVELCSTFMILGGGNSNIFYSHLENWGRWTHFDEYFSNGLKPPTSWWFILLKRNGMCVYSSGHARICVVKYRYMSYYPEMKAEIHCHFTCKRPFWGGFS